MDDDVPPRINGLQCHISDLIITLTRRRTTANRTEYQWYTDRIQELRSAFGTLLDCKCEFYERDAHRSGGDGGEDGAARKR